MCRAQTASVRQARRRVDLRSGNAAGACAKSASSWSISSFRAPFTDQGATPRRGDGRDHARGTAHPRTRFNERKHLNHGDEKAQLRTLRLITTSASSSVSTPPLVSSAKTNRPVIVPCGASCVLSPYVDHRTEHRQSTTRAGATYHRSWLDPRDRLRGTNQRNEDTSTTTAAPERRASPHLRCAAYLVARSPRALDDRQRANGAHPRSSRRSRCELPRIVARFPGSGT